MSNYYENKLNFNRILVFDTETTDDEFQNLKFGSFIIENDIEQLRGIFYNSKNISKSELKELERYAKDNNIILFKVDKFINEIFYPEVLNAKTLCVGFNLPFDLSRLAIHYSDGRYAHKNWFSFQLSKSKFLPRIKIKQIDSNMSFIQFAKNTLNFKGHFLDLKTIASVFSDNKHISLKKSGEIFNCKINIESVGINSPCFILILTFPVIVSLIL